MASQNTKTENSSSTKTNEPELEGTKESNGSFFKYTNIIFFLLLDLESSLLALERLDRGSPDLWPDTSKFCFLTRVRIFSLRRLLSCLLTPVLIFLVEW